jgi:hypothetical protein
MHGRKSRGALFGRPRPRVIGSQLAAAATVDPEVAASVAGSSDRAFSEEFAPAAAPENAHFRSEPHGE